MTYRVEKSIAHQQPDLIAECDEFDAAVAAARNAGAEGEPSKRGPHDWCFAGGPEDIGYWITKS